MNNDKNYNIEVFSHPFTAIIAGPSGSGKTRLLLEIIKKAKQLIHPTPQRIIFCYGNWQKSFDKLNHVEFHQGLPDIDELMLTPHERKLVIIDDLMEEANNNINIQNLFTRGSHHFNISVFLLTQNIFSKGKFARTINLNAHYTILFDYPRDRTQIKYLAREAFPANSLALLEAYTDATQQPHGYILIDNKQGTPEEIRIQTNITDKIRTVYKIKSSKFI